MLNYLAQKGYLIPTYGRTGRRGVTRRYSYRDLVIARIVQKLLDAGLEIKRLKKAIQELGRPERWKGEPEMVLRLLATDGTSLFFPEENGTVRDLTRNGQLGFAFLLDMRSAKAEIEVRLSETEREHFSLENRRLIYARRGRAA